MENHETRELLLSRLLGMLLTDGGLALISGKQWRIYFSSNSRQFVGEFSYVVGALFGINLHLTKHNGAIECRAWVRKQIKEELLSLSPSYRKMAFDKNKSVYPECIIPDFIWGDKRLANEFLRYAFTGDGSVVLHVGKTRYGFRLCREVRIACEHPVLRGQYLKMLKSLGYSPRTTKHEVVINGQPDMEKFLDEIGFVDGVSISGQSFWKGITKNDLLGLCLESFNYTPSSLGKSREEIKNRLRSLLSLWETI